jgi:small subunit ribosomal protein S20
VPIIKSAKKRAKTARKAAIRNSKTKRNLKSSIKLLVSSPSLKNHSSANSHIDKAVKKGVIHKNKAARLKRRAAAVAKAGSVKPAKTAKKAATKTKAVTKKPTTKKK